MKHKLYVIHDRKANTFEPPVASENDATVIRWFERCIQSVPTMRDYPEDFALLQSGYFDTETGQVSGNETLQHICSALDCIKNNQEKFNAQNKVSNDSSIQSSTEGGNTT